MGAQAQVKDHYLGFQFTYFVEYHRPFGYLLELSIGVYSRARLRERHSQVGSLAGAAHLLNDNTGVLSEAQWEQKSHVEQKGKSFIDFDFQYEYKPGNSGLSIL